MKHSGLSEAVTLWLILMINGVRLKRKKGTQITQKPLINTKYKSQIYLYL